MKRSLAVLLVFLLAGAATAPAVFAQEEEEGWPRALETTVARELHRRHLDGPCRRVRDAYGEV